MISQAIDTYALVGTARDRQWVNVFLAYLKLCSNPNLESLKHQDDSTAYTTAVIESLKAVVDNLGERSLFLNSGPIGSLTRLVQTSILIF
jgi:hypothetical protein